MRPQVFILSGLIEAADGYDRARIIDTLVRYKWLADKDSDRITKKTRVHSESKNLYHIQVPDTEEWEI